MRRPGRVAAKAPCPGQCRIHQASASRYTRNKPAFGGFALLMNRWIYDIVKDLDEESEAEVLTALDELETLYEALDDIDRDIAEQFIGRLSQRLEQLRSAK
jgi:hypothetical protein